MLHYVVLCKQQGVQQYMQSCRAKNPPALDFVVRFPIYTMHLCGQVTPSSHNFLL